MKFKKRLISQFVALSAPFATISAGSIAQEAEGDWLNELEEVIVVASTRTGTDLSKTAAAVTALSASSLSDAGITDPTSLQELAPNLSIDRTNGLQITIRGVSSTDNTEKGDPSAAFLLDGVYIARAQAQEVSFFDLEQVEILRGPQGTLYGRNATAGLINVISAKPDAGEFSGFVDVTLGDFSKQQATAVVNVPVSESNALRFGVNIDKRDSYLNKTPSSERGVEPAKDNLSFRLSGLFELSEDISVYLKGDHSSLKGSNRSGVKLSNFFEVDEETGGFNNISESKSSDELRTVGWVDLADPDYDNSTWGLMSEVNWNLSDALTMTYVGSYREFERHESYTGFTGTVEPIDFDVIGPRLFDGEYEQNSNELRLTYNNDFMNLQGGVYQFSEESGIAFLLLGTGGTVPGEDNYVFGFPQDPTTADSLAFFTQGTFNLSEALRFTAGIRRTDDEKSRRGAAIHHMNLNEEFNFVQDDDTNPTADSLNNANVEYSETTWKLGLDYDVSDQILVYGTVSTGYKAGGFNDGCLATDDNCSNPLPEADLFYEPETLTAYEAGLKMDFDNGLRTFVSVFHYDYKNLQLSRISNVCGGACQVTSNAGEAETNGLELEGRYYFNSTNRVNFAATWLDAEYTDYQYDEATNFSGTSLNRSPEYTLNLGYENTLPLDNGSELVFAANYLWNDGYIVSSGLSVFEQPSFSKSNLSVKYISPDNLWQLQAFVKNIEDEVTISNAGTGPAYPALSDGTVNISDPRTMGVRFSMNF